SCSARACAARSPRRGTGSPTWESYAAASSPTSAAAHRSRPSSPSAIRTEGRASAEPRRLSGGAEIAQPAGLHVPGAAAGRARVVLRGGREAEPRAAPVLARRVGERALEHEELRALGVLDVPGIGAGNEAFEPRDVRESRLRVEELRGHARPRRGLP